ncbi:hypothetical protein BVC80_9097g68 [Macleaya cordata]|uniref:Uncharacterized protein n=1 Tax=Macleaya cordata TaxID=56857 RepID=A0A200QET4_MACCD|nr:hypothetical protein BVC80_9097g68 [Macleaya cordata]
MAKLVIFMVLAFLAMISILQIQVSANDEAYHLDANRYGPGSLKANRKMPTGVHEEVQPYAVPQAMHVSALATTTGRPNKVDQNALRSNKYIPLLVLH